MPTRPMRKSVHLAGIAAGLAALTGTTSAVPALAAQPGRVAPASPVALPRLGETGRLIMGAYQRIPEDMDPAKEIFGGSILTDSWPIARVTNEQGKLYFIVTVQARSGKSNFFILTPGPNGMLMPDPRVPLGPENPMQPHPSLFSRYDSQQQVLHYATPEGTPADKATDIAVGRNEVHWTQGNGMIDLRARAVTPGVYIYLPYRRQSLTGVSAWVTQEYPAEGTVFGEKVSGYFHLDQAYGRASYEEELISHLAQPHFMLWINEFEDGSTEAGVFTCGPDNYRGAVVVDDKGREVVRTEDISLNVQYGEKNKLLRTDFMIDGKPWEFVPAPNAQSPFPNPGRETLFSRRPDVIAVYDGTTLRKGEKRKLRHSWTAVETTPGFTCPAR